MTGQALGLAAQPIAPSSTNYVGKKKLPTMKTNECTRTISRQRKPYTDCSIFRQHKLYNKELYADFIAAQIKTLSFLAYIIRIYQVSGGERLALWPRLVPEGAL